MTDKIHLNASLPRKNEPETTQTVIAAGSNQGNGCSHQHRFCLFQLRENRFFPSFPKSIVSTIHKTRVLAQNFLTEGKFQLNFLQDKCTDTNKPAFKGQHVIPRVMTPSWEKRSSLRGPIETPAYIWKKMGPRYIPITNNSCSRQTASSSRNRL